MINGNSIIFLQISTKDITNTISNLITSPQVSATTTAVQTAQALNIDWTFILSTLIVTVSVLISVKQLFGPSLNATDDALRKSQFLKDIQTEINKEIDKVLEENKKILKQIEIVKDEMRQNQKKIDEEIKETHKKIDNESKDSQKKINEIQISISKLEIITSSQKEILNSLQRAHENLNDRVDYLLQQVLEYFS